MFVSGTKRELRRELWSMLDPDESEEMKQRAFSSSLSELNNYEQGIEFKQSGRRRNFKARVKN